jgi:uncharacterized protein (DUF952 family)
VRILHVADIGEWTAARTTGRYEISSRGRTLADEGFIHASTSAQAPGVLSSFYADLDPATLTLLVIDIDASEAAGSPVRWDDVPGRPDPFPHVYGPIVPAAVVAELPVVGHPGAPEMPEMHEIATWNVAAAKPT